MAEEENTKSLDDEIQGVIRTNQTLLRKKGLLKRLLEDSAIQHLLKHVLKYNEKEKLLEEDEEKLLENLKTNQFNLDKTIERMVQSAALAMKSENITDKMMNDIEKPQPDEEPSQAQDDIEYKADVGEGNIGFKKAKGLTKQQALELGLQGDTGNRSLRLGRSKIDIVEGANYKILHEKGAQVRTEADIYSEKKEKLPVGQIVKVIGSQEVVDPKRGRKIMRVKVAYDEEVGWISTVSSEGADIIEKVSDNPEADGDGSDADGDGSDADGDGSDAEAQAKAKAKAQAKAKQAKVDAEELEFRQQAIASNDVIYGGAE